jgi:hypothetical protein
MSYWAREIAGWLLVLVGLGAFYQSYDFLMRKRVIEAVPLAFVAFVIFRGGIHLLKVAVAAQAARSLRIAGGPAPARRAQAAARPVGPTASKSVLPGPRNTPRVADDEPAPASRRRE